MSPTRRAMLLGMLLAAGCPSPSARGRSDAGALDASADASLLPDASGPDAPGPPPELREVEAWLKARTAYSLDRPDDPIPPCDPGTLAGAWQDMQGNYPALAGHDYLARADEGFALRSAWIWDGGARCPATTLEHVQWVAGGGRQVALGVWGLDTLQLSCAIGFGTHLFHAGSCREASSGRTGLGVSFAEACGGVAPGTHDAVCVDGSVCYPVAAHDGPSLLSDPEQANRRAEAGFVSCAP